MDDRVDPPHDRVRLSADERAALASFERSLHDDQPADAAGRARARLAAGGRWLGRLAPRFVRLAPWIAVLGALALPPAISASNGAGLVCAAVITTALTTWFVTARGRLARVLTRPAARPDQHERRRSEGHP
jgi:hypothetical protein